MRQPTATTKEGKKGKTPYEQRPRGSIKVAKAAIRLNRRCQRSLKKKASQKIPASSRKLNKKSRGSMICSHCHKKKEELNQNEAEQVQETKEKTTTPSEQDSSQ
ncbi:hypothetical protein CB1_000095001 [Camelus ferus]|nr:hypothetical protein CB1_000095001 [Camelus ferus]